MRKMGIVMMIVVALGVALSLNSCKKKDSDNFSTGSNKSAEIIEKLNRWFNQQKFPNQPNKTANVELLRNNLDFSSLKVEQLNEKQFVVIPIRDELLRIKKNDDKIIGNLLVLIDKTGNVEKANIVLFKPKSAPVSVLPEYTFHNIYNSKKIDVDGQFKFLSISGDFIFSLGYDKGKPVYIGRYRSKGKPTTSDGITTMLVSCWDYYLVITYYVDGEAINETWEYLGTVCEQAPCDSKDWERCQNGGSGGGGGDNNDCCIPDPMNVSINESTTSILNSENCGNPYVDPITGKTVKQCTLSWQYSSATVWFFTWNWNSDESIVYWHDGSDNKWKILSILHVGSHMGGSSPSCTSVSSVITSANATILSPTRGRMDITARNSFKIDCCLTCTPFYTNKSASITWNAPAN